MDPYLYALIYAGLGQADQVFEYLNVACDKKSAWLPSIVVEPKFDALRSDPRYRAILARMKLPAKPAAGKFSAKAQLQ